MKIRDGDDNVTKSSQVIKKRFNTVVVCPQLNNKYIVNLIFIV